LKSKQKLGGKEQFYEFLQSIAGAPILVRDGIPEKTSSFLDAQTTSITVAIVAFSPEYGLASTISITAKMSTGVSVDYSVEHFQSLEGEDLETYKWVSIIGFMLAGVIFVENIVTIMHKDIHQVICVVCVLIILSGLSRL